jgi:long-chain-fatty-acyl-CoA reductase
VTDIPKIICGDEIYPTDDVTSVTIEYVGGEKLRIPLLTPEDVDRIAASRRLLHDIPLGEVTEYIRRGAAGISNLETASSRRAVELCCSITGFSREMVEQDYQLIGGFLSNRNVMYDLLDAELGDHRMTDDWVRRQVARVRAFPLGRILHVMAGNVPMSSIYSLVRSVLTKNHSVVKLPSRDPVSCLHFARSLIGNNPCGHPLSEAISTFYCRNADPVFDRLIQASDMVCGWGQGASLLALKRRLPQGVPLLEFGPRRSLSLIYADECDPDKAAMRIAHDVAIYDQEACFSPQRLFVIGRPDALVEAIGRWLDVQHIRYPKGRVTDDSRSHIARVKMEALYRGAEVRNGASWTIIVADDPLTTLEHPLGRTLFIHPVASESDMLPFIDDDTQSISIYPFTAHAETLGALVCARGVARVCEAGMISHFRQGFTHDGQWPLQQFVRLAYLDETLSYVYKYGSTDMGRYEMRLFGNGELEQVA